MDYDPIKFTFRKPIEHNGVEVASITIREVTVNEVIAAERIEGMESMVVMFAGMSGGDKDLIRKIGLSDWKRLMKEASHLLGNEPDSSDLKDGMDEEDEEEETMATTGASSSA